MVSSVDGFAGAAAVGSSGAAAASRSCVGCGNRGLGDERALDFTPDEQASQRSQNEKRVRALPPGPVSLGSARRLLAAGNGVVDALDVEVHAEDLTVGKMVAALALNFLAV